MSLISFNNNNKHANVPSSAGQVRRGNFARVPRDRGRRRRRRHPSRAHGGGKCPKRVGGFLHQSSSSL